jgi:hypothetical protein
MNGTQFERVAWMVILRVYLDVNREERGEKEYEI